MRAALFGSLGVARPVNLPRHMVRQGTPGRLTGAAATYAAVVAGHHLDLRVVGITPATLVIPFTGGEATRAAFEARINAIRLTFFQRGGFIAQDGPAGQIQLEAFLKGSMAGITVLATTSADVLASLGFASGQNNVPASGWGLGPNHVYKAAVALFGGVRPTGPLPANQHGVTLRTGMRGHLVMVDRNAPTLGVTAVASDSTRFAPLHQPIP